MPRTQLYQAQVTVKVHRRPTAEEIAAGRYEHNWIEDGTQTATVQLEIDPQLLFDYKARGAVASSSGKRTALGGAIVWKVVKGSRSRQEKI